MTSKKKDSNSWGGKVLNLILIVTLLISVVACGPGGDDNRTKSTDKTPNTGYTWSD